MINTHINSLLSQYKYSKIYKSYIYICICLYTCIRLFYTNICKKERLRSSRESGVFLTSTKLVTDYLRVVSGVTQYLRVKGKVTPSLTGGKGKVFILL